MCDVDLNGDGIGSLFEHNVHRGYEAFSKHTVASGSSDDLVAHLLLMHDKVCSLNLPCSRRHERRKPKAESPPPKQRRTDQEKVRTANNAPAAIPTAYSHCMLLGV